MHKIVVATENKGKVGAAERAFQGHKEQHPVFDFEIIPVSAESGVADTPLSDEEGLLGCANRIADAKETHPGASIYVAMEGILTQVEGQWFVRGWTMLEDTELERTASASGASVQVPDSIVAQISSAEQFSHAVRDTYAVTAAEAAEVRNIGANGVFTAGEYGRPDTFYDGVRICMALVSNDRNWS